MVRLLEEKELVYQHTLNFDMNNWIDTPKVVGDNLDEMIRYAKADFAFNQNKTYRVRLEDKEGKVLFMAERINGTVVKCWEAKHG